MSEREFKVTATTTVTAQFRVYAESEDDARDAVAEANPEGSFDFAVRVPDGEEIDIEGWDVLDVTEAKPIQRPKK